jgi:hypothetical protein
MQETSYEKAMEMASFQPSCCDKEEIELPSYEPSANLGMDETHHNSSIPHEKEASDLPKIPSNVPTEVTEI